jgi:hypothetical protein
MEAAWLITVLAIAGVLIGLWVGQSRLLSAYLAASGGGLLFGIALFWLLPETAAVAGWWAASALTFAVCVSLILMDRSFFHLGHDLGRVAIGPLLIATAIHSFVDGWSVRALASQSVAGVVAPAGLMLHKVPEGLALGWSTRRTLSSPLIGAAAGIAVELFTLVGAYSQPRVSYAGTAAFGTWWTAFIMALISGSFLFLGFHALVPHRKNTGVMVAFVLTLALVGTIGLLRGGNV